MSPADGNVPAPTWQDELRAASIKPTALLAELGLAPDALPLRAGKNFPLRVTPHFRSLMQRGDAADPLLRQVWPHSDEDLVVPGFVADAVGDIPKAEGDGLIHKYQGRALVMTTGACAVHCRYCFRRHFPYGEHRARRDAWQPLLARIAADASLSEIILSGGDPLVLDNEELATLVDGIAAIPHVQRVRIHTRTPVVAPTRIDDGLVALLRDCGLAVSMVLHVNHPQELHTKLVQRLQPLRHAGVYLLNQAVLLRGVNDDVAVQKALSEQLFAAGVLPYYLHLLDLVAGASHFWLADEVAIGIVQRLASELPGYLVPRLARETSGQPAKTWIAIP